MVQRAGGRARCVAVQLAATALAAAAGGSLVLDASGALHEPVLGADVALVALCEVVLAGCVGWAWLATTVVVAEVLTRPAGAAADAGGHVAAHAPTPRLPRLVPTAWRRVVLLACGAAVAVGVTVPAQATPGPVRLDPHSRHAGSELAGLPMPDRPVGRVRVHRGGAPATRRTPAATTAPTPTAAAAAHPSTAPTTAPTTAPVADLLADGTTRARAGTVIVRAGDSLWSIAAHTLGPAADDPAVSDRWRAIYDANRVVLGDDPDLIRPGQHLTLPG